MAPDVFVQHNDVACGIERCSGVQSAGFVEGRLRCPQFVGQGGQGARGEPELAVRARFDARHPQCIERRFPAHAATRGCVEVSLQAPEIDVDTGLELDTHDVVKATVRRWSAAGFDERDVVRGADNRFREQEAGRQLVSVDLKKAEQMVA